MEIDGRNLEAALWHTMEELKRRSMDVLLWNCNGGVYVLKAMAMLLRMSEKMARNLTQRKLVDGFT